jgi:hypothetical protein
MSAKTPVWRHPLVTSVGCALVGAALVLLAGQRSVQAGSCFGWWGHGAGGACGAAGVEDTGTWHWLHSSDQEKRVVISLYNHFCIRCHGVDGRGVWAIPGVPDFTDPCWQASRTDSQLARSIIEGRRAVMPPFRDVLSREQACALAGYLRTFVPGTEVSRPDLKQP